MTYHFKNPSDGIVKHYLENSKVIAVVGLSDREEATSHRVIQGDARTGLSDYSGQSASSRRSDFRRETVYASLKDIPFSVDIVDVYRRSEFCQMWRVIFCKWMLRFSGHNWVWKMKKPSKSFVQLGTMILSWTAVSGRSIPVWFLEGKFQRWWYQR